MSVKYPLLESHVPAPVVLSLEHKRILYCPGFSVKPLPSCISIVPEALAATVALLTLLLAVSVKYAVSFSLAILPDIYVYVVRTSDSPLT